MHLQAERDFVLSLLASVGPTVLAAQAQAQRQQKSDGTPVSDGDRIANELIVQGLRKTFPADAILSEEETDDLSRLQAKRLWIIDPIDGTSSYINQRQEWAIQIALLIDGQLAFGALGFPQWQRVYYGIPGHGAWRRDHDLESPCPIQTAAKPVLLCSRSKRNKSAMEHAKTLLHEFSHDSVSSVGLKTVYLIEGKGSIYVNPTRINEWDYAAPAAVLIGAGGHATNFDNQTLPFNQAQPQCHGIIFSNLSDHANMVQRLQDMRHA